MGQFKKEKARVARSKEAGDDRATNLRVKGENFYRDAKKLKYINMLKSGKPIRNAAGKIIKAADFQSTETTTARVAPNRKWFGKVLYIDIILIFLHFFFFFEIVRERQGK